MPNTCPFNPILFPRESMSEGQCGVDEQMHKEKKDILQKQIKKRSAVTVAYLDHVVIGIMKEKLLSWNRRRETSCQQA